MIDGLKAKYRTAIIDALSSNDRVERAVLLCPRATETYTSASDVDIALFGDRLTSIDQARLNGIMDELTIPQRVDLLLYAMIDNDVLRKHIEKQGVEWYRRQGSQETELKNLLPKHRSVLEAILREHLPDTDVWAYGNRVSSPESDGCNLNLVLRARDLQKIPDARMDNFKRAVRDASFPFPVSAQDWACMSEQFRRELERERMVSINKPDGEASKAWPMVPLGQVAELTLSSVDKKTKPHEYPVLLCNYMDVYSNQFIRSDLNFMAATATEREIRRCALRPGDVIITKDSEQYDDIGVPALVRDDIDSLVCGYHLAILRQLPEAVHGSYLFYALQIGSVQYQFHSYANGVTRFGLRKDDILRVNVPFPPLPEQRAIAHVLGALDDKIELNLRMNKTLKAMVQAIFKNWFIDFEPVRAKMVGRDTGLSDDIADHFPRKFIDSELGGIPEGWEVKSVSDFASIKGGKQLPKNKFIDNGIVPIFGGAGVMGYTDNYNANGYVISVGRVGAYCGKFFSYQGQAWINNNASHILQREHIPGEWLFLALRNLDINSIKKGAAQPFISNSDLAKMKIIAPNNYILELFQTLSEPLSRNLARIKSEMTTLIDLRDTLLPKLVSGEVRLCDVERMVEMDTEAERSIWNYEE